MFNSRIITNEEKEEIKKVLENLLEPYLPKISISLEPTVIHCRFQTNNEPWKESDEYMYNFDITTTTKGNFSDGQTISQNWTPQMVAGVIAHEFFMRNDGDVNSPLAKKLWKN